MSGRVSALYGSRSGTGADERHVSLDPATYCFLSLQTEVVRCLPTCAQGSSATVTRVVGYSAFWAFWVLLGVLCIWRGGEVPALLVFLLMSTRIGLRRCAYRRTRPLGGGRWGALPA